MNKRFHSGAVRKYFFFTLLAFVSCTQVRADRAEALGEEMICICGCNQLLSGCTMINCTSGSIPMKAELNKYIDRGMTDDQILTTFEEKYGQRVRSSPPTNTSWFNVSAWIVPFVALLTGGLVVIYFLRNVRAATVAGTPAPIDTSKYDKEIEEELKKLTPED